jgi:lysophospholipase L1-like esterase
MKHLTQLLPLVLLAGCGSVFQAPPTVVFIGDSITYNWSAFDSVAWKQHPEWNNQGLIGQNSLQLRNRFEADVVSQHPDEVHILTGTNDVYPGWVLCGGDPVFDTCSNIIAMVAEARAAGIKVVLATIPPWGVGTLTTDADPSPARFERIDALNQWILAYGIEQGIPVVDYHSALQAADGENYVPSLTVDGCHPSPAGYDLMTPMAEKAIQNAM